MAELLVFFQNYTNRVVAYTNQDMEIRVAYLDRESVDEIFLFWNTSKKIENGGIINI